MAPKLKGDLITVFKMNEELLIEGAIAGNRKMQYAIYEQNKGMMFSMILRIVVDIAESEDVLQETFIEVFRDLKNFQRKSTLSTWMNKIAIRKAIRKTKRQIDTDSFSEDYKLEMEDGRDYLTGEDLDRAIKSLPTKCRTVFCMIEVEGYKHQEVAEMLRISEGTSKSQLSYAKKLLQQMLSEYR
ncbi:MAG: RNA polymerase subunit sigma-24 [Bacteroidetes bacterium]|nr:RNA polymerase sigma factor [Bacteroidia bacterium]PCH66339.1 MAG: RNA polymerase subunit sigma-24 [Bacteroidota bacterium]